MGAGLLLTLTACGGGTGVEEPGTAFGGVPALAGVRVMVFPVQRHAGVAADPTPELVFALGSAPDVRWLAPAELEAVLRRSPGLDARLRELPVDVFLQREVRRIGDPLYGILRRLAAVTGGEVALVPVEVRHRRDVPAQAAGADAVPGPGRIEVVATLISPRTGRVLWTGVVEGRPGAPDDHGALASAVEALVRRLAPRRGAT